MDISTNVGKKPSHIIGIGASASGLEALEQVFANYNSRDDVAFVIIQHLSPDYIKSDARVVDQVHFDAGS